MNLFRFNGYGRTLITIAVDGADGEISVTKPRSYGSIVELGGGDPLSQDVARIGGVYRKGVRTIDHVVDV